MHGKKHLKTTQKIVVLYAMVMIGHSFISYLELGAALGMCTDRVPREMKLCRHAYRECIAQFFISNTAIYGRLAK